MFQLCVENTGLQAEREENVLDPVITLGIEHVLLIMNGPGLSPSVSVSPRSILREEGEADWLSWSFDQTHALSQCTRCGFGLLRYFAVCVLNVVRLHSQAWTCCVRQRT